MKKETEAQQYLAMIRRAWRHRKGFKILGKEVISNNEIPGKILDVFDNLGFTNKDGIKPIIVKGGKKKKDYGWHLVIELPAGKSFQQCLRAKHFFECATNSFIVMEWNGALQMDIQTGSLPSMIPYEQIEDDSPELNVIVGYTQKGPLYFNLCEAPHVLVGGQTGWGKTMALHCIANALLGKARICICDPKRIDFRYLKKHILLARDDEEICNLLRMLNQESDKRIRLIENADVSVTKIQELDNPPPYIVVFVDEMAQLSKEAKEHLWRLGSLSRAAGIHLVAATQYPYAEIIPSTLRNLFEARLCFRVASESSSRVILGEEGSMAAWLPPIKGRAIWKFGHEFKEVQTMFLSQKERNEIANKLEPRRWDFEGNKKLLPR